ncbi:serine/threonine protein kinase [Hyalangium versicolor]|uniref:serine/threonine protein kinase n=1 Tax=Hyalangium versicolor TaxID=2861190 RepID=UPI001CCFC987|nr:serine/threonine-protein kinase [Hyalangium versicolor]
MYLEQEGAQDCYSAPILSGDAIIPFGKYELLERLGLGGMAIVYRARYMAAPGVTKPVVIKKVLDVYAEDPSFVEQFIQEARVTVGLNHGNIVHVFDFGQVNGEYYLAMELVEGHPLSRVLKKAQGLALSQLPAPLAVHIAIELCKGLHHAHTRKDEQGNPLGLVHRDVSPDNVLISYEGEVKISDFGVAKAQMAGRPVTEVGMVKGKYLYFSPEQALGESLDARSDVYAVGVLLYRMLCGRLPVEGSEMVVMRRIVHGELTPPLELNPALDAGLVEILEEAMAKKREDRIPSAEALHHQLSEWLATRAPMFPVHNLKHMMGLFYERELTELGRPPSIPPRFREQVIQWVTELREREGPERSSVPATEPRKVEVAPLPTDPDVVAVSVEPSTGAVVTSVDVQSAPPRKKRWGLWLGGVLAVMVGVGLGLAAKSLRRPPPLDVHSEPPGAQVILDGVSRGVTPLRLEGIARDAPHALELGLKGMKPWTRQFEGGALETQLDVTLEPVPPPPPPPSPPPVQEVAQQPTPLSEESFAARLGTDELPARFTLQEKWHSFSTKARSLQQRLNPERSYTVWTSGSYTSDVPISEQDLSNGMAPASSRSGQLYVFLEGEGVPDEERLFMVSSKPRAITKTRVVHVFALVGSTVEHNVGRNFTVHMRDTASKEMVHLKVDPKRFAHQVALENRYSVRKLDPGVPYSLDIVAHEGSPVSGVALLVVPKAAARVQVSGQGSGEVRYVLSPGHYTVQGARELWFALPRAEKDGQAEMDISLSKPEPVGTPQSSKR